MVSISPSDISSAGLSSTGVSAAGISPAGDADTARVNCPAVKASTPVAATAPTGERVIRDEAGAD